MTNVHVWKLMFIQGKFSFSHVCTFGILFLYKIKSSDDRKYCEGEPARGGSGGRQHKLALGVCFPWEGLREGTHYALEGQPPRGGAGHQTTLGILAGGRSVTPSAAGGGSPWLWLGSSCVQLS